MAWPGPRGRTVAATTGLTTALALAPGTGWGQEPRKQPRWGVGAQAEPTLESNPRFGTGSDSIDSGGDFYGRLNLFGHRALGTAIRGFTLEGQVGGSAYARSDDLNHWSFGLSSRGTWSFSRRFSGSAFATVRRDHARYILGPAETGVLLGQAWGTSLEAGASASWRPSRRLSVSGGVGYHRANFEASGLTNDSAFSAHLEASRPLHRGEAVSLVVEYGETHPAGSVDRFATVLATWERTLGRRLGLRLAVGPGWSKPAGAEEATTRLMGSAALYGGTGRHSYSLEYRRYFSVAFGLGRSSLSNAVSAGYGLAVTRRLGFTTGGTWIRSTDPDDTTYYVDSGSAAAGLRFSFGPSIGVDAAYSYLLLQQSGLPHTDDNVLTIRLSWSRSWR